MTHHRIAFLIPRPDVFPPTDAEALARFHRHWHEAHGEYVMPVTPVTGYVQNRPVDGSWHWGPFHGVAELFFDSPEGEEAAWEHPAWKGKLAPDEEYVFDVDNGFSSLVEDVEELRAGDVTRTRVLALGGDPAAVGDGELIGAVHRITLEDEAPVDGGSRELLSVFVRGRDEAARVAEALGGQVLVAETIQMIRPEGWPNV
ncbi:EthD domain-containing protein [Corynebacterium sp. 335C]